MSVHSRNVDHIDHEESDASGEEPGSPSRRDGGSVAIQELQSTTETFQRLEPEERPSQESRRRRHRRRAYDESISSIDEATDTQLLKRIVLAIEDSEWRPATILGLLKRSVDNPPTAAAAGAAGATTPKPSKQLGQDPRARILDPGPRLTDYQYTEDEQNSLWNLKNCARSSFRHTNGPRAPVFVVIGLLEGPDMIPKERIVYIKHPAWVFWYLWWGIIRLRGIRSIFSLKDCTAFKIYTCPKREPYDLTGFQEVDETKRFHQTVTCSQQDLSTLAAFRRSWGLSYRLSSLFGFSRGDERLWTKWIRDILDDMKDCPDTSAESKQLSLEIVLGWSPLRISIVVLTPFLLSLAVGLWFQSRNPTDLATIQTAWGIASYIVTAGSLVAALLAILSSVGDK